MSTNTLIESYEIRGARMAVDNVEGSLKLITKECATLKPVIASLVESEKIVNENIRKNEEMKADLKKKKIELEQTIWSAESSDQTLEEFTAAKKKDLADIATDISAIIKAVETDEESIGQISFMLKQKRSRLKFNEASIRKFDVRIKELRTNLEKLLKENEEVDHGSEETE